ncbi:MAG: NERD domain-containing protein [Pseudomonadota bacterium]|nr:NERD domain-containing protein [Pseudomonadota bacterium]
MGLIAWRIWRFQDKRRSPLTNKLLNLPGENLRKQVAKHDDGFNESAAIVIALGPIFLCAWLLSRLSRSNWGSVKFGWGDALLLAIAAMMVGWCLWRMIHHATRRRNNREGLEAEIAVAQSLTPLLAEGALVFHDFPADRYNIDHIVIGRSVVFAVETKSRKKPAGKGPELAHVSYDGTKLIYPGHIVETKPIEQARYQAEWLAGFLRSGVGEQVRVIPVLALPGWFVDPAHRSGRPDVLVNNCHNSLFMVGDKFGPPMAESFRKRIAHVLAERYPALEI